MLLLIRPDTVADAPISLLPCTRCTTILQNLLSDLHVASLITLSSSISQYPIHFGWLSYREYLIQVLGFTIENPDPLVILSHITFQHPFSLLFTSRNFSHLANFLLQRLILLIYSSKFFSKFFILLTALHQILLQPQILILEIQPLI
ncbi:hypothetical protein F2Q68_00038734 [Brassica cretica]|uniref:Uncharacterized protein n=1 Tax=Brassica cretica TaxID=69181 RepID=A0A8S9MM62_BRACR|nr:hypothetical protein F2Q68_00038734 [Brassica cretica]